MCPVQIVYVTFLSMNSMNDNKVYYNAPFLFMLVQVWFLLGVNKNDLIQKGYEHGLYTRKEI